ncbi:MAG: T9SS type A sorting domain-containing protein [Salibacteraceae bacterium]
MNFYNDILNDVLYSCGHFGSINELQTPGVLVYDEGGWDRLSETVSAVGQVQDIIVFHDSVFIGGSQLGSLKKWNGTNWVLVGGKEINGQIVDLEIIDHELWVAGYFDSIGNQQTNGLARWNGEEWKTAYDLPTIDPWGNPNRISAVIEYKGEIYIGGNFNNAETGMDEIAKWNGTEWTDVGGGIKPHTFSFVNNFIEYHGDLYVLGRFLSDAGNADNNIMRWNGEEWLPCGGGLMSSAGYATVFEDKLWVTGQMSSAAGMPADGLAVWDGEEWCVPGNEFSSWPGPLAVYNDSLFIGGGFQTIDGDSFSYLAKWTGEGEFDTCGVQWPNGSTELGSNDDEVLVYPNPATDQLTVQLPERAQQTAGLNIYAVDGRCVVQSIIVSSKDKVQLDISALSKGMYVLVVHSGSETFTARFVKQ